MRDTDAASPEPGHGDVRGGSTAVAAGILLSRLSGLLREVIAARVLGLGVGAEAFRAALRVPNLLQNLLGEGVLSASFVPVYSQLLAQGRRDDARRLAGAIASLLVVIVSVIVVGAVIFAEPLTRVLAWGFVPGTPRFDLTVTLVRIMTPGIGVLVLSAWCLAILNSHRRFFLSYVAPVMWNIAIVAAVVAAALVTTSDVHLATAMAWGALVGSVLQLLIQLPAVLRVTGGVSPTLRLRDIPGVQPVTRRFGQVLAGRGGVQIAGYVDLVAASLLAFGAVAALGYAQTLFLLPIALFGMSMAAAELPTLSTIASDDARALNARVHAGLSRIAFFVLPTTVAFLVLGEVIVGVIYGGGRFDAVAVRQVGIILAVYSVGLPALTASRLLQSVCYGGGDARTPAVLSVVRVTIAASVGIALMLPLDAWQVAADGISRVEPMSFTVAADALRLGPENLARLGAVGLAAGSAIGAWIEWLLLKRRLGPTLGRIRLFGTNAKRVIVATCIGASVAFAARVLLDLPTAGRLTSIAVLLATGITYLAAAHILRAPEALAVADDVRRRLRPRDR